MASQFVPVASLRGKSVTGAAQFDRKDIDDLIRLALAFKASVESGVALTLLQGRVMTPMFFEDSSRTFTSFCAAMLRLGGQVVNFKVESSSVNKGETLSDTVRTLDSYSDVLVMRHPQVEALDVATKAARHPVINAGNGSGEHPSQALLDTLTMTAELGTVDGLTIALIGDLKMGRTVHSLLKLLTHNFNVRKFFLVAPDCLQMPDEILQAVSEDARARHIEIERVPALTDAIVGECDVLYATRLQKERFLASVQDDAAALESFSHAKDGLLIDKKRLGAAKEKMIVMHPLPRVDELSADVDEDPRAAYFRQMEYGMYMRMAILYSVLAPQ